MTQVAQATRGRGASAHSLRIHALHVGTLLNFPVPAVMYQRGWGEVHDVAMIMFVIVGGEHPIVVDTGTPDPEFVRDHHGYDLVRPPHQEPLAALEAIGVDPAHVGTVVNTHLHWDHCSNNHLFPSARVVVQRAELQYAIDPLEPTRKAYERVRGLTPSWMKALDRVESVDGDVELAPGVTLLHLPGHTPGSQGVLVRGAESHYLLAGDCVDTYANWRGDARLRHIPNGSFTDLTQYMGSFRRMDQLDCVVVPSHDLEVVERGVFA
jgi:N-acyl homoserine lactone hydrolase